MRDTFWTAGQKSDDLSRMGFPPTGSVTREKYQKSCTHPRSGRLLSTVTSGCIYASLWDQFGPLSEMFRLRDTFGICPAAAFREFSQEMCSRQVSRMIMENGFSMFLISIYRLVFAGKFTEEVIQIRDDRNVPQFRGLSRRESGVG